MTDPLSTAASGIGVVSLSLQLLGGCIKGFVILSTARNLEKDAAVTVCMLNLQEIQLTDWARHAGLLTGERVLDRRLDAKAVEETLFQLQILLMDTDKLRKKYGLEIKPIVVDGSMQQGPSAAVSVNTGISDITRHFILVQSKVAESYSALQRFQWATIDKSKIEKLVTDIHFFIRELWHLLNPWRQYDVIVSTQSIAASMISLNEKFDQLSSINESLTALRACLSKDVPADDIDRLATAAMVKAYRVGLEQVHEQTSTDQEPGPALRQRLLASLENLSAAKLSKLTAMDKSNTMGVSTYDGQVVFVEEKPISASVQETSLARVRSLAALRNLSKSKTFGSLQCRGIIEYRDKVEFVFYHPYPESKEPQPRSLLELFHHRDGIKPPSLTDRMRLALRIARLIQNFHRAGWLHKSLRSENVLFFSNSENVSVRESLAESVLAGFAFSRPDSPTEISEQPSADPRHDIYRHPAALGEPSTSFTAEMDVYSLGMILLEIAEWRALRHLVESVVDVSADIVPLNKIASIKSFLVAGKGKGGTARVQERMGDIYASVVQMCLTGKIVGSEHDQTVVRDVRLSLLDTVVQRLSACRV